MTSAESGMFDPRRDPSLESSLAASREQPRGPTVGARFGRYRIERLLGKGGMGAVYRARDEQLGRDVALKVLHELGDAAARKRFGREARAVAALRHPGIVGLLDAGDVGGVPWIAMELVAGETLERAIERGLEPREAARIAAEVARAIAHAHEAGIVHRDLKPANVLLEADGRARVTDFGLARAASDAAGRRSEAGEVAGTPAFMAPEQAAGERGTPLSDVYGIGAILYEALTGRPPHEGATPANVIFSVLQKEPPAPRSLRPRLHVDLETICRKALEKEPERRYESALALADDLERFLAGEAIEARPLGAVESLARAVARRPALVFLAATAIVAVPLATYAFIRWRRAAMAFDVERARVAAEEARAGEERRREAARRAFFEPLERETDPRLVVARATDALARTPDPRELAFLRLDANDRLAFLLARRLVANERLLEARVFDGTIDVSATAAALDADAGRLLDLAPRERARWLYARHLAAAARDDLDGAVALARQAASADPEGAHGLAASAVALLAGGEIANGLEVLRTAARRAPDAIEVQLAAASALDDAEKLDEGLALLRAVVAREPCPRCVFATERVRTLEQLVDVLPLLRSGRSRDAVPRLEAISRRDPLHRSTARFAAVACTNAGLWQEAVDFTTEALGKAEVPLLRLTRATALLALAKPADALPDLEVATRELPRDFRPSMIRARALYALGRYPEALSEADRAVALGPDSSDARYRRGTILARVGRLDEALTDMDWVIAHASAVDGMKEKGESARAQLLAAKARLRGR